MINASESVDNLFAFSGEYWDKSAELQYLRARWYDPSIGRFISKDTYEGEQMKLFIYHTRKDLKK